MKTLKATLLLVTLSLPLWAANHPDKHKKPDHDPAVAVPEGGKAIAYLLVSGAAIAGVVVLRRRSLSRSVQ
jgi:fumarate reductase subunit D